MYVHCHNMHRDLNKGIIDYNNVSSYNYVHRLALIRKVVLMNVGVVYMPRTIQNCFLRYRGV